MASDASSTPVRFTALSGSDSCALALTTTGEIHGWGVNRFSQLGHGHVDRVSSPIIIEALTDNGDLYTFGWNHRGRLGVGDVQPATKRLPQLAVFVDEKGEEVEDVVVVSVACGAAHSVAIDGKQAWGFQ